RLGRGGARAAGVSVGRRSARRAPRRATGSAPGQWAQHCRPGYSPVLPARRAGWAGARRAGGAGARRCGPRRSRRTIPSRWEWRLRGPARGRTWQGRVAPLAWTWLSPYSGLGQAAMVLVSRMTRINMLRKTYKSLAIAGWAYSNRQKYGVQ